MKIILASKSPRRRELMTLAGFKYDVIVSNVDETFEKGLSIIDQSKRLAYIKAKAVFDETCGDRAVVGSDTMVVLNDKIYGKPKDREDAIRMLTEFQGKKHTVYTSLSVLIQDGNKYNEFNDLSKTDVYFKNMTREEIESYVDNEKPFDKAGAYAIQSSFCVYVEKIDGDYFTVVGLPINKVYDILKKYI